MSDYQDVIAASTISGVEKIGFEAGLNDKPKSENPHNADTWQSAAWEHGRKSGITFRKRHRICLSKEQ